MRVPCNVVWSIVIAASATTLCGGQVLWNSSNSAHMGPPCAAGAAPNHVVVLANPNSAGAPLYHATSIDSATGAVAWSTLVTGDPSIQGCIAGVTRVYCYGSLLSALDALNGTLYWQVNQAQYINQSGTAWGATAFDLHGTEMVLVYSNNGFGTFNGETGAFAAQIGFGTSGLTVVFGVFSTPALPGVPVVIIAGISAHAHRADTGALLWNKAFGAPGSETEYSIPSVSRVDARTVAIPNTTDGFLYTLVALDIATGKQAYAADESTLGQPIGSVYDAVEDVSLALVSAGSVGDSNWVGLNATNGDVRWTAQPPSWRDEYQGTAHATARSTRRANRRGSHVFYAAVQQTFANYTIPSAAIVLAYDLIAGKLINNVTISAATVSYITPLPNGMMVLSGYHNNASGGVAWLWGVRQFA